MCSRIAGICVDDRAHGWYLARARPWTSHSCIAHPAGRAEDRDDRILRMGAR